MRPRRLGLLAIVMLLILTATSVFGQRFDLAVANGCSFEAAVSQTAKGAWRVWLTITTHQPVARATMRAFGTPPTVDSIKTKTALKAGQTWSRQFVLESKLGKHPFDKYRQLCKGPDLRAVKVWTLKELLDMRPIATATATFSSTPTNTATASPTVTATATYTATATATATETSTPTATATDGGEPIKVYLPPPEVANITYNYLQWRRFPFQLSLLVGFKADLPGAPQGYHPETAVLVGPDEACELGTDGYNLCSFSFGARAEIPAVITFKIGTVERTFTGLWDPQSRLPPMGMGNSSAFAFLVETTVEDPDTPWMLLDAKWLGGLYKNDVHCQLSWENAESSVFLPLTMVESQQEQRWQFAWGSQQRLYTEEACLIAAVDPDTYRWDTHLFSSRTYVVPIDLEPVQEDPAFIPRYLHLGGRSVILLLDSTIPEADWLNCKTRQNGVGNWLSINFTFDRLGKEYIGIGVDLGEGANATGTAAIRCGDAEAEYSFSRELAVNLPEDSTPPHFP